MTDDRNRNFICGEGCIAQIKSTRKAKKITVIGLKNLLGEPICCIVIIKGREKLFGIWAGIDLYKEKV